MRAAILAIAGLTFTCAAQAQAPAPAGAPPGRSARIGMLCSISCDPRSFPIVEELRRLGWVEGRNLTVDRRNADGHAERLPGLAAELVALRPDVIVTGVSQAAMAAKAATASVPIVFSGTADPVGIGLVHDLARPGGNVTGVTGAVPGALVVKTLGLIRDLLPGVRRVAVFINPASPVNRGFVAKEVPLGARQFGFDIEVVEVPTWEAVPDAIAAAKRRGVEALYFIGDPIFHWPPERVPGLVAAQQLPAMYYLPALATAGGLVAYGLDQSWVHRHQALYVDRVLRGAAPADLPVEQPTAFTLVVNLRTARALGVTVPPSILAAADDVLE